MFAFHAPVSCWQCLGTLWAGCWEALVASPPTSMMEFLHEWPYIVMLFNYTLLIPQHFSVDQILCVLHLGFWPCEALDLWEKVSMPLLVPRPIMQQFKVPVAEWFWRNLGNNLPSAQLLGFQHCPVSSCPWVTPHPCTVSLLVSITVILLHDFTCGTVSNDLMRLG